MSQTQTPASAWCAKMQRKLMDALDAAWALVEHSDDPTTIAKAREKSRLCGQMAAAVRKVATLVPATKDKPGLLPTVEVAAPTAKAPAAQAVAMRAALDRMGRR